MRAAGGQLPIAGTNGQGRGFPTRLHVLTQVRLDCVNRHDYWDHTQGEGNLKGRIQSALFHNLPMVKAVHPGQDVIIYLGVGNLVIEKAWEQVPAMSMTVKPVEHRPVLGTLPGGHGPPDRLRPDTRLGGEAAVRLFQPGPWHCTRARQL